MRSFGGRLFVGCVIVLIVSMTVSAAVLGQEESSEPRPRCNWNAFTLECEDPPLPTATPTPAPTATPRPRPSQPDPDCTFDTSTFTWECPDPTATPTRTPRPTATYTRTPRPTATYTRTPRPTATYTRTPRPTATHTRTPRPTATHTRTPTPSSRGWLTARQTTIDVGGSTTVTAEWEPPGLSTWLGFATDSTAVLGRSSQCSGTRFVEPPSEARLTVYGCEGGTGTVELRVGRSTGTLLDSITITVRGPTPTPTPGPSGSVSASPSTIQVGQTTTVRADWEPTSETTRLVYPSQIVSESCPGRSSRDLDVGEATVTLRGCQAGEATVELRTFRGNILLDSTTITVQGTPTPIPVGPTAVSTVPPTPPTVMPTDTPTNTPTPSPTSTLPTGWIRVEPAEIATGQSTTVTAGWSPSGLETKITVSNVTVLGSSHQCSGVDELLSRTTLALWGCARGTAVVELRTVEGNNRLASVVVTVRQAPVVTSWSRIGYRWFKIDWRADPAFVDFRLEYVSSGSHWQSLGTNTTSGPRAIINSVTTQGLVKLVMADIRGVPYGSSSITVRVIGTTADGFEASSNPFHGISRDTLNKPSGPTSLK